MVKISKTLWTSEYARFTVSFSAIMLQLISKLYIKQANTFARVFGTPSILSCFCMW